MLWEFPVAVALLFWLILIIGTVRLINARNKTDTSGHLTRYEKALPLICAAGPVLCLFSFSGAIVLIVLGIVGAVLNLFGRSSVSKSAGRGLMWGFLANLIAMKALLYVLSDRQTFVLFVVGLILSLALIFYLGNLQSIGHRRLNRAMRWFFPLLFVAWVFRDAVPPRVSYKGIWFKPKADSYGTSLGNPNLDALDVLAQEVNSHTWTFRHVIVDVDVMWYEKSARGPRVFRKMKYMGHGTLIDVR